MSDLTNVLGQTVSGAVTGAGIGSAAAGIGAVPGAIIGGIGGLASGLFGVSKDDSSAVGTYNPLQTAEYRKLQAQRRGLETGNIYAGQQAAIKQAGAGASKNAMSLSGGDIGTAIQVQDTINRGTGTQLNALYSNNSAEGLQLSNVIGNLTKGMADREYQISMADKLQKLAVEQQSKKDVGENLMTSLTKGLSSLDVNGILKTLTGSQYAGQLTGGMGSSGVDLTNIQPSISTQPQINYDPNAGSSQIINDITGLGSLLSGGNPQGGGGSFDLYGLNP